MTCKRQLPRIAVLLAVAGVILVGCRDSERQVREAAVVELPGAGAVASPAGDPGAAVRRVLEADEEPSARYIKVRYGDAAGWLAGHLAYAREMEAISLDGTPVDFAEAFRHHQEAWAAFAAFLEAAPKDRLGMFLDPAAARTAEDQAVLRRAAELNQAISATWTQVEMIASTLGVGEGPTLRAPPAPVGSAHRLIRSAARKASD